MLQRKAVVLVTMFSLKNFYGHQPGTCFFYDGERANYNIGAEELAAKIKDDADIVLSEKSSLLKEYNSHELVAFVELVQPPVSLVIVGAGNDAIPMVEIAMILGWQITIIDGRPTHANRRRFPKAHQVIVAKPAEAIKQIAIDERTAFVLMTHNYNYDLEMLGLLLRENCRYIGVLGPKKRLEKMMEELNNKGFQITDAQQNIIFGPVGLDLGAEAAEEIALSVMAEIKAVLTERSGTSLRDRSDVIHSRSTFVLHETKREA